MIDVLFIVKRGQVSGGYSAHHPSKSSGLKNSARFVVEMLNESGISAELEVAVDGNCIDRLVTQWNPKVVILEAIWCPPSKLEENIRLHPKVWWIVRIHSEVTFLAMEGMAVDWLRKYTSMHRVMVSANSDRTNEDLFWILGHAARYLPNFYSPQHRGSERTPRKHLHVGCFGAVRPMKNQLAQAVAAIRFAQCHSKELCFHINASRTEQSGEQVLKNLRALFHDRWPGIQLIEHGWLPHEEFLELLSRMDISMAVSLTESFNIVTADAVMCDVPVVVSKEIRWVAGRLQADPTNIGDIVEKMKSATGFFKHFYFRENRNNLKSFNDMSRTIWNRNLRQLLGR